MDKPIVFKFIENGLIFVYDLASGRILNLSPNHWRELEQLCRIGFNEYKRITDSSQEKLDILNMVNKGFFCRYENNIGKHPIDEYAEDLLERRVKNLTLQVTRDCNFKCRYCQYASSEVYERNHAKQYMNEDTAIESLKFLYNHSRESLIIDIGFYGGEPLLNYDIIKNAVNYSKKLFVSKRVRYNITTNASLLTEEISDFFVQNAFDLTLSIDGSENIQNKHRRFLNNGMGTYDIVYKNLMLLKKKHTAYFNKKVKFHPVFMSDDNINEAIDFFQDKLEVTSDMISPVYAGMSGIDYYPADRTKIIIEDEYSKDFVKKLESGSKYAVSKLLDSFNMKNNTVPSGACLAGYSKLFVNVEGDLYPCERVIESPKTCVGNINDGFNLSAIRGVLNSWQDIAEQCKKCWAFKLCSMCVVSSICGNNDTENKKFKLNNCTLEKEKIATLFRSYINSNILNNSNSK